MFNLECRVGLGATHVLCGSQLNDVRVIKLVPSCFEYEEPNPQLVPKPPLTLNAPVAWVLLLPLGKVSLEKLRDVRHGAHAILSAAGPIEFRVYRAVSLDGGFGQGLTYGVGFGISCGYLRG